MTIAHILAQENLFFDALNLNAHGLLEKSESIETQCRQNIEDLAHPQTKQVELESFLFLTLLWEMPVPFIHEYGADFLSISPDNSSERFGIYRSRGHYHPLFKSTPE